MHDPTAREAAERWIRALAGSDPVEDARAEAEVEFRSEQLAANWRESLRKLDCMNSPGSSYVPPHWQAGIKYAKQMSLGYGEAASRHIHKPHEFESFLRECVAVVAERTYRQKLQPYDGLTGDTVGRAVAHFHELVRAAVIEELGKLTLAAWKRYRERRRGTRAGTAGTEVESAASKPEPAAAAHGPVTAEVEPAAAQVELVPFQAAADSTGVAVTGNRTAEAREARLQAFIRQHNTSIAAVGRAARVAKPDLQHWRHGEMKSDSVMARRIEDVLSGKTALPQKDDAKG